MPATVRVAGANKNVRPKVRVLGAWKDVLNIYTKVSGVWKPLWSYVWLTGAWSACSLTCGGGTQTRPVTCQRSDAVAMTDAFCLAGVGTKPSTSQSCNTQACGPTCYYHYPSGTYAYACTGTYNATTYYMNGVAVAGGGQNVYGGGCKYWRTDWQEGNGSAYEDECSGSKTAYQFCRCCPSC